MRVPPRPGRPGSCRASAPLWVPFVRRCCAFSRSAGGHLPLHQGLMLLAQASKNQGRAAMPLLPSSARAFRLQPTRPASPARENRRGPRQGRRTGRPLKSRQPCGRARNQRNVTCPNLRAEPRIRLPGRISPRQKNGLSIARKNVQRNIIQVPFVRSPYTLTSLPSCITPPCGFILLQLCSADLLHQLHIGSACTLLSPERMPRALGPQTGANRWAMWQM